MSRLLFPHVDQRHPTVAPQGRRDPKQPAVQRLRHSHRSLEQRAVPRRPEQPRRHNREQMEPAEAALSEPGDQTPDLIHRQRLLRRRAARGRHEPEQPEEWIMRQGFDEDASTA